MHKVEKGPNILYKSCDVHNNDFESMHSHFSTLCLKVLKSSYIEDGHCMKVPKYGNFSGS